MSGVWLIENLAIRMDFSYIVIEKKKIFLVIFDGSTNIPRAYSISETSVK